MNDKDANVCELCGSPDIIGYFDDHETLSCIRRDIKVWVCSDCTDEFELTVILA